MTPFVYNGLPTRVVFGRGTLAKLPEEIARLGLTRVLVLATPQQEEAAREVAETIGHKAVGVFAGAVMHTPVEVTEKALAVVKYTGADGVVSLGGGSTTGLGKAIAVRTGADQVVVPTTYAGSEMTDILGETAGGEKTTRRDPAIRPEVVVYDVDLTLTLPLELTVTSALNAIAHGMEALYAPDRNPVIEGMVRDALPAFRDALPVLARDPQDREARGQALFAAWGCSTALGQASMALHHKLAHVLGGSFGLPHAETHAVLLPHTTFYNEPAAADLLRPISDTFGDVSAGRGLWHFAKTANAPLRLADLGLAEADLDRASEIAARNPYANPRPVTRDGIRQLLQQAFDGRCPA